MDQAGSGKATPHKRRMPAKELPTSLRGSLVPWLKHHESIMSSTRISRRINARRCGVNCCVHSSGAGSNRSRTKEPGAEATQDRYWHKTDIPEAREDVRCRGVKRTRHRH